MSTVKLNATGTRWIAELVDYNFKVKQISPRKIKQ